MVWSNDCGLNAQPQTDASHATLIVTCHPVLSRTHIHRNQNISNLVPCNNKKVTLTRENQIVFLASSADKPKTPKFPLCSPPLPSL